MDNTFSSRVIWESGSRSGLILGLVTAAFLIISHFSSLIQIPWLVGILSFLLWLLKFAGCICLMLFFMKNFANSHPEAQRRDILHFGMVVAVTSALVYAAFYLVYVLYIAPEAIQEALDSVMENTSGMLDSNAETALEQMAGHMPAISFVSNFLYCTVFGCIFSALMAGKIKSDNPFDETNDDADIQ